MGQIGTIRVDTQSNGTVSVPVFDTGDSGSDVYEFVRVQTGSGTGFIPVEDTSNAAYPYLRVKSQSHGTVAMTDRSVTKINASGGTTVVDRNIGGEDYRIHAFENVGTDTFTVNKAPSDATIDVLVVAGGGGAGGAGAGAGGATVLSNVSVSETSYSINVGDGGAAGEGGGGGSSNHGSDGGDSSAFGTTMTGGGGGGTANTDSYNGGSGGSGAGAAPDTSSGFSGISGQGNRGGDALNTNFIGGAGGGGAGSRAPDRNETISRDGFTLQGQENPNGAGNDPGIPGDGGIGLEISSLFGTQFGETDGSGNAYVAGGGGGGYNTEGVADTNDRIGKGGIGGGGDGSPQFDNSNGNDATDNTGGGGGGSEYHGGTAGTGGSGIVLIRYKI